MIHLDPDGAGLRFDGIGALSNSSSRLLLDYLPSVRDEILDYLFLPGYGASLQLLKLEIGGDTNSTTTAEPSHSRTPSELDPDAGWSWWIAKQARARNPDVNPRAGRIRIPADCGPTLTCGICLRWLKSADQHGLRIDYLGGGNEWYDPKPKLEFFVALKRALADDYRHVRIVATDSHAPPDYWWAATAMRTDSEFADAVDILGEHDVCVWNSEYRHCHVSARAPPSRSAGPTRTDEV